MRDTESSGQGIESSGQGMRAVADPEVVSALGLGKGQKRMRWLVWLLVLAGLAGSVALGRSYLAKRAADRMPAYVTEPVKKKPAGAVAT